MSAIAGILSLDHRVVEAEPAERMASGLAWRGPDDEGSYRSPDGRAAMAARRLAAVGESAQACLPLANETHDVWLVLDGEIINHRPLRHSLELVGHRFGSNLDMEVALHAYEQWGLDFIPHLQGAFALALWDDRRDRLVLARDRLGRKPLYFTEHGGKLAFASAIKPLLDELALPRLMDPAALACHLSHGWVAPPRTLAAGICKLGPGEMMVVERGNRPYRSPYGSALPDQHRTSTIRLQNADRQSGNLRTLLECSIADRMMGDGRIGVRLSPSTASAIIAISMSRLAGRHTPAVAVTGTNDQKLLLDLARAGNCDLIISEITAEEATAELPLLAARLAEPVASPQSLETWFTARNASRIGLSTLMGDDGAAELLLTHPAYDALRRATQFPWKFPWLRRLLGHPTPDGAWITTALAPFVHEDWTSLVKVPLPVPTLSASTLPNWLESDPLAAAAWTDLAGRGAESICISADSASLAHGVHSRLPFLDEALVAYALSMTASVRAPMNPARHTIRRLTAGLLPQSLVSLPTNSSALPLSAWMAGSMGSTVETRARHSMLFQSGLLSTEALCGLLQRHRQSEDLTQALWTLAMLTEWCDANGLNGLAEYQGDALPKENHSQSYKAFGTG